MPDPANNTTRDKDLTNQDIREEYAAWLRTKVERSRASANAGNLVPAAEVEAAFAVRRAATRRRLTE